MYGFGTDIPTSFKYSRACPSIQEHFYSHADLYIFHLSDSFVSQQKALYIFSCFILLVTAAHIQEYRTLMSCLMLVELLAYYLHSGSLLEGYSSYWTYIHRALEGRGRERKRKKENYIHLNTCMYMCIL